DLSINARLDLAVKEGVDLTFPRTTSLPRYPVADKFRCAACLVARWIEPQVAQQHEHVHGGIPPAVPCRAAPRPVGRLETKQPCPIVFGSNPRALSLDFFCRRTNQVPHHLPTDRRVRIEQPLYHRPLRLWSLPLW